MDDIPGPGIYSLLDKPEILQFVFYPRRAWTPAPEGATDFLVPVGGRVFISCRFYPADKQSPCLLFFHGNGEVACDYDGIAPLYNEMGVSLFVADYRGYGGSGGSPSFSTMLADARLIFAFFRRVLEETGFTGPVFVMGRSLGIHSALELVTHHGRETSGLIVESGAARMARLLSLFGTEMAAAEVGQLESAVVARARSVVVPVLILHGERDSLVPFDEAVWLHDTVSSSTKRLVLIPGADHNDIMWVGAAQYFAEIKDFIHSVSRCRG